MKNLILAVSVFVSAYAAHQHPDRPSVHGMLVVGKEKVYLSHLPMFHSPHDYQVILEAELDPAAARAYLASKPGDEQPYHTIAPETGVLPEMAQAGRTFKAALFRGHFERGGEEIAQATVKITRVLYFKKFDPLAVKNPGLELLHFGNAKEQFSAHVISAKPDFDQIARIVSTEDLDGKAVPVSLPGRKNEPSPAREAIYTETGDLSF